MLGDSIMRSNYKKKTHNFTFYSRVPFDCFELLDLQVSVLERYMFRNVANGDDITLNTYMEDACLGNTDPLQRERFAKMLEDVKAKKIDTIYIADPFVISTDPHLLGSSMKELVMNGATVIFADGTSFNKHNIHTFNYAKSLALVENQTANDLYCRFDLIGDHEDRKVWFDTWEEEYYVKTRFEGGTERFHHAYRTLAIESKLMKDMENNFCESDRGYIAQYIYDSHFCEDNVEFEGSPHFMCFEVSGDPLDVIDLTIR